MLPKELEPWIEHARDIHRRVPVVAAYLEMYG